MLAFESVILDKSLSFYVYSLRGILVKIAYFDCFSGISGDMILGALVDAGLNVTFLKDQLAKLPVYGYKIYAEKVKRSGISGTKVHVTTSSNDKHAHHHNSHLNFIEIKTLIEKSNLGNDIKNDSIKIFHSLAVAEAKVHNTSIEEIHFHEVGAVDSIVDIVGSVIAIKYLGVEKLYFSPIPLGRGFVKCEHGTFPVPVPATVELLRNHLVRSSDTENELTTPTGAAIITTMGEGLRTNPEMRILHIGYGAGNNDNKTIPNLLRIFIGELSQDGESDEMWIVETNIDNMSGEILGYVMDKLFEAGAVDSYFTPIQMKKGRPGIIISALVSDLNLSSVELALFNQTTTFGIRKHKVARKVLIREFKEVDTQLGKVKLKIGRFNGNIKSYSPEYEDCRKIAAEKGIPLKEVYNIISKDIENYKA